MLAVLASIASVTFAGTLAGQDSASAQRSERAARVTALSVRGVRHVNRTELLQGLATKASACRSVLLSPFCLVSQSPTFSNRRYLDPVELQRDALRIRLFYWRRGYRHTAVVTKTEPHKGGVRVTFNVTEGKPTIVEKLDVVQSERVLPERVVNRSLKLRDGQPLDLIALDSSRLLLRNELLDRGYADAEVELDTTRISQTLDSGPVTLVMRPGQVTVVRSIEIEGNRKVTDRTVGRLLTFRKGDRFRRSALLGSQRNLYLSGLFSEVEVQTPPSGDSARDVQLRVTETTLNRLDLTTGFTTADFVQFEARYTRNNFFRSARRLTLRGTVSNLLANQINGSGPFYDVTNGAVGPDRDRFLRPTWSVGADFLQPWIFSPNNQLGASIFSHRRSVPGVVIERGGGASMDLTRHIAPRFSSTLAYTYESSSIDASDAYFCLTFGACLPETIDVLSGRNPLAPVSLVTQIDRSNAPFYPTSGYRARLDLEYAAKATRSDFQYNRVAATASTYLRVATGAVLAGRVRFGYVNARASTNAALGVPDTSGQSIVHPRKRFYAGGSQSVRGFGENQLGPRVLTVAPEALTDTALTDHCTTSQLQARTCNPNIDGLKASAFQPQPLGGTSLAEATIEYRFPIVEKIGGTVFVDGAVIGTDRFSKLLGATTSITPGFGLRLDTPVGPVRLDLGIRPRLVERLPVVTQVTTTAGKVELITLDTPRRYDPLDRSGNRLQQVLSRLTLHLAIGPAF
jgi:outer membrane protein insertion porin family